jgi:hypothetical protein
MEKPGRSVVEFIFGPGRKRTGAASTRVAAALVAALTCASAPGSAAAQGRPPWTGRVTSQVVDEKYAGGTQSLEIVADVTFEWNDGRQAYEPTGTWTFKHQLKHKDLTTTSLGSGSISPKDGSLQVNPIPPHTYGGGGLDRSGKIDMTVVTANGYSQTRSEIMEIPWWGGSSDSLQPGRTLSPDGSIDGSELVRSSWGTMKVRWHLEGGLPAREFLVITPAAYHSWRPEAGRDERTAGNEIEIEAKLLGPDGGAPKVKARKIVFELTGTSREPGVDMNFPLPAAATRDFDLQFTPKGNPPGRFVISGPDNQRAETVPGKYTSASIKVSAFDWGAWSTLKVTAEMEDGLIVAGHLENKGGTTSILLPLRTAGSRIADGWKRDAGLSLPDDDDSEPGPPGNDDRGDGFTLYEEYRGFHENGVHVSGNPKKIDFFVRNFIGADAEPGIFLFEDLTGAEVHAKLLDSEFDRKSRVMNANHHEGAHRVDQHGVFLETQPKLDGGLTVLSKAGWRGRPVITLSVNLQPRDSLTSMVTSENVPLSDQAFAYDRAVAHELLHSVGADHHGEGDGRNTFFFVFGDDPKNATGKAHFRWSHVDGGGKVAITDEATGRDLASILEGDMMLAREELRPGLYPYVLTQARKFIADRPGYAIPWTAEQIAESDLDASISGALAPTWFIGAEHGQSSGAELCVMRYSFARMYPKKGQEDAFFVVREPRTERAGMELCRSPVGTGVNEKGRKPQPRYGDAAASRGACAGSITFNDALPLKSDSIPKGAAR